MGEYADDDIETAYGEMCEEQIAEAVARSASMNQKLKRYEFSEMRKKLNEAHLEIIRRREYRGARESDVVAWLADYVEQNFVPKAQLEKAEAALLLISAPHCDYRTFESETIERLIECIIADTDYARQYFKEKENT